MRADRRRRGRAIRRARRIASARTVEVSIELDTSAFSRSLAAASVSLAAAVDALARIGEASKFTSRVIFERLGLAYLSPRAGTRRQLLHQGRAPRRGGR